MGAESSGSTMLAPKIVSAPSNIAIIKYMGKTSAEQNLPTNPSISYTLNHLRSFVSIESNSLGIDTWQPLDGNGLLPLELSDKGKYKFLKYFGRLKEFWSVDSFFSIKSANNFPSDCGIASSSSSYAALTLAAATVFNKMNPKKEVIELGFLSAWSRLGSGSSCRSFFDPWAIWKGERAEPWDCAFRDLNHCVLLVDSSLKEVSSSEAHLRVTTSPLFADRIHKVTERLKRLERANSDRNWNQFSILAYEEFQEMHELFETSQPRFTYRKEETLGILNKLNELNKTLESKILITMDAGNNIHCMALPNRRDDLIKLESLFPNIKTINSWSVLGVNHV